MHSIFKGQVTHNRLKPKKHFFKYDVNYLFLDLEEIQTAFSKNLFWSNERFNLASFHRKDYLGVEKETLINAAKKLVKKEIGVEITGKVFLLTTARYFGFCFNPVSFYYCYDKEKKLTAIISDITNTPWNEKHAYVHDCRDRKFSSDGVKFEKRFHVSPFMPMDIKYKWTFTEPRDFLYISMDNFAGSEKIFNAGLKLKKRAWSTWELNKILFLTLPMSIKAILLIYINAFILFLKRVKFYPHP